MRSFLLPTKSCITRIRWLLPCSSKGKTTYYLTNLYDCFVGYGSNLLVIYTLIFCQMFKAQNSFSGRIQLQLGLVSISLEALLLETKGGQKGFHQAVDDVKGTAVVACILAI